MVVLRFEPPRVGGRATAHPERVEVTVFDAAYDTLYTGTDSIVAVPDLVLGSNEQVLVEACGIFPAGTVCEQRPMHASPKRFLSDVEVEFPTDPKMERGTYQFSHRLQRARFGMAGWEEVEGAIPQDLEARVRVAETEDAGVRVPLRRSGGRFDLARADGYRDFQYYLRSALRDGGEADVEFSVAASYRNGSIPVGTTVVTVSSKTEDEQVAEVSRLAEAAGRRILRRLSSFIGNGRAFVFVNDWEYAPDARRYRAEIELHWRPRGSRTWHELLLGLDAREDGTHARLEFRNGNRAARRRWQSEVDRDVVDLGTLEIESESSFQR